VNASTPTVEDEAPTSKLSDTEAEFETALREIEARVDRRLFEAAELRFALEQELGTERYRAVEQEREVERLRLELKKMAQAAAAAEAKLSAFEQMLEAVEDDIDERIETVTSLSVDKLSEATAELRGEISRLNEELERIRSTWVWRTTSKVRKLFIPRK
jgi:chromosome segregation ATPase